MQGEKKKSKTLHERLSATQRSPRGRRGKTVEGFAAITKLEAYTLLCFSLFNRKFRAYFALQTSILVFNCNI